MMDVCMDDSWTQISGSTHTSFTLVSHDITRYYLYPETFRYSTTGGRRRSLSEISLCSSPSERVSDEPLPQIPWSVGPDISMILPPILAVTMMGIATKSLWRHSLRVYV